MERISLDEFIRRVPLLSQAFAASTRSLQAEGAEGFVGDRFENRTEVDWLRELAAYHEYVEAQERIIQDRRTGAERRRV